MTPAIPAEAADFVLRPATSADVPVILACIQRLAEYERLAHECIATEAQLRATLFGATPSAEVVLAFAGDEPAGFALWFQSYSTFLAKPGLYLEDLFVYPQHRGRGLGRTLLRHLARVAVERDYGRVEWSVLDWNVDAIGFYRSIGAELLDDWRRCRLAGDAIATLAGR
ncbi:MAG TPA: GNAT family N-acetyltransferase [Gemmatimonadaceae bacterium]|nr:GNAT family N-acetyltransferase [Gemmatimonadaceae bacterium]